MFFNFCCQKLKLNAQACHTYTICARVSRSRFLVHACADGLKLDFHCHVFVYPIGEKLLLYFHLHVFQGFHVHAAIVQVQRKVNSLPL